MSVKPGAGAVSQADASAVASFAKQAGEMKPVEFVLHIIPDSMVGAFARGDVLQVLLVAILFGFALMFMGARGAGLRTLIDDVTKAMFGIINIVMLSAPFGAFGAMAYTIGVNGPKFFGNLFFLIATFYATSIIFVVVVLGAIAWFTGFSIFRFLAYIKDELLIVLGTSFVGKRVAAIDGEAGATRLLEAGGRDWWCRPDTRSISTAPTST